MKRLLTGCLLCLSFASAGAATEPSEKDAIAMVERGVAYLKAHGKEELIKKIALKDPDFVQGSLYLYLRDIKSGILLVHPINPAIVGKDLVDVPDANGKVYRREIIERAQKQGKGWVDYMYKNPANGKLEPKTTYFMRVGEIVLEAGIYKK